MTPKEGADEETGTATRCPFTTQGLRNPSEGTGLRRRLKSEEARGRMCTGTPTARAPGMKRLVLLRLEDSIITKRRVVWKTGRLGEDGWQFPVVSSAASPVVLFFSPFRWKPRVHRRLSVVAADPYIGSWYPVRSESPNLTSDDGVHSSSIFLGIFSVFCSCERRLSPTGMRVWNQVKC